MHWRYHTLTSTYTQVYTHTHTHTHTHARAHKLLSLCTHHIMLCFLNYPKTENSTISCVENSNTPEVVKRTNSIAQYWRLVGGARIRITMLCVHSYCLCRGPLEDQLDSGRARITPGNIDLSGVIHFERSIRLTAT